MYVAIVLAMCW